MSRNLARSLTLGFRVTFKKHCLHTFAERSRFTFVKYVVQTFAKPSLLYKPNHNDGSTCCIYRPKYELERDSLRTFAVRTVLAGLCPGKGGHHHQHYHTRQD